MNYLEFLNKNHPIRNDKKEKEAFRNYVSEEASKLGLLSKLEKTKNNKNENVIIGDIEKAEIIFTAHFDTPFKALFPNLMLPRNRILFYLYQFLPVSLILICSYIPANIIANKHFSGDYNILAFEIIFFLLYFSLFYLLYFSFKNKKNFNDNTSGCAVLLSIMEKLSPENKEKAAFIFFDNEEKGKLGSKAYYKDHKDFMENKLLINFDCVGNGENILFIESEKAKESPLYKKIKENVKENENYSLSFFDAKSSECNSDHKNFPCSVAVVACKKTKNGILYTPNIHTEKDVEVKEENIQFISDNIVNFL